LHYPNIHPTLASMKKIIPLLAFLIVTVLTISFVHPGKMTRSNDWVPFEDAGCKMLFPKTPINEAQTVNTAVGELKLYNYTYEVPDSVKDDNLVYLLSETEFSDSARSNSGNSKEVVDKFFRGAVDGGVSSAHGKLLTEEIIQLDGYPGRKFRADIQDGVAVMTMKAYLVKNKLYMLQVITESKKDFNKSMDKFMNSFTLKH